MFSSPDCEAYQQVDDDLGRLVQWTVGSPQDRPRAFPEFSMPCNLLSSIGSRRSQLHYTVAPCSSLSLAFSRHHTAQLTLSLLLSRSSGRSGSPSHMFVVRMVALSWTKIAFFDADGLVATFDYMSTFPMRIRGFRFSGWDLEQQMPPPQLRTRTASPLRSFEIIFL